ncbi:MAG: hypothetical protein U9N38_00095 [Thermodesulfobacteriota bacterium]|nr:hypothetical protein [Thermodesulfobacteriota bacterium]
MKWITYLFVIFAAVFVPIEKAHATDWEAKHTQLKTKIEAEEGEPHHGDSVSKDFEEYIHWLGIKAADRDRVQELAAAAGNAGNPYWEERFLDLMELAQDSGESTLWMADYLFLRIKTKGAGGSGDAWKDAVFKAERFGKRLYLRAQELSFDAKYVRESVRCLMRFALGDVETGYIGLYHNRDLRHGTQYDSEGNLIMPDMDFDITCLPRSAFHVQSEGTQGVPVDEGLSNVDQIRDICEWFQLFEYSEGTDLMNQFLQDFLCDDKHNPNKGLQWYLALAQKYKLKKSEEHILGFYGTVRGKVETLEGKRRREAPGAKVQITDKPNTLKTTANEKGRYEIKKAPLHCKCSPYPISAEYKGDRVDSKYNGPLKKSMPSWKHKKDLLIPKAGREWSGTLSLDTVRRFQCNHLSTKQLSTRELKANDEHSQKVNLTISLNDFDLARQPAIPVVNNLIGDVSGEIHCQYNKDHFTAGRAKKTECYNEGGGEGQRSWIWVSPGSWDTKHKTWLGQASRNIKKENITLLIVKDMDFNKEAMQDLQQQMKEAMQSMDMAAVQQLQTQMVGMVQGDQDSNTIPIRVRIQISVNIAKKDLITGTYEHKRYDACLGRYTKDESGTNTMEESIVIPMAVELEGTYTRGKDGHDTITATANTTEAIPGGFGSGVCPDATMTVNGQLNLKRHRK